MTVEKDDVYKAFWWLENQRLFFFGAFLIGSILIISLKYLGAHGGLISLIAISIMFAYAIIGTKNKIKVRLDILGDNLYYLGFLYTLISLSFSLYQLGKGQADINSLLENFGLAIGTTLTGLALRVFFNQPKADITEYENTIRLSLTEATANFVGETSKIGRDISTLRSVLNQIIEETRDSQKQATANLGKAIEDQIGLLDQASTKNQNNIDELLNKIKIAQDTFAKNFKSNSESMTKAISDSMSQIKGGSNGFVSSFTEMNKSLDELKNTMIFLNNILGTWESTIENIIETHDQLSEQQNISATQLAGSHESIIVANKNIATSFTQLMSDLADATTKSNDKILAKSQDFEETFKIASKSAINLSAEIDNISNKIRELSFEIPKAKTETNLLENNNV